MIVRDNYFISVILITDHLSPYLHCNSVKYVVIQCACILFVGSLLNLAKHPASTVQILGAEKALFRALKTRRDTPKYGLIYHASLVGQTTPKNKGKVRTETCTVKVSNVVVYL